MRSRSSIFAAVASPRAKWLVFLTWFVVIFASFGAGVPEKYTDAQENESTSFLPGDAESTKALTAAEELQGGELAPAVILYRRESGLTAGGQAEDRHRRQGAHGQAVPRPSSRTARPPPRAARAAATAKRRRPPPRAAAAP